MTSTSEIDLLVLSTCDVRWLKVAMIIGRTQRLLEARDDQVTYEELGTRIAALVTAGRLEAQGDVTNWRHSEVRLPTASH